MGKRGPPALPLEDTGESYRGFKRQTRLTASGYRSFKYIWTPGSNSPDPGKVLDGMKAVDRHLEGTETISAKADPDLQSPEPERPESGQEVVLREDSVSQYALLFTNYAWLRTLKPFAVDLWRVVMICSQGALIQQAYQTASLLILMKA